MLKKKSNEIFEKIFYFMSLLAVLLPLGMLALLVANVIFDGMAELDFDFVTSFPSRFPEMAGIGPALVGSIYLIMLTGAIALPIGIGAALHLEEYGHKNFFNTLVDINITNLAGVPSVIYGLLGLEIFVRVMAFGTSLLAGACTLALLVMPILITASREALRAIPSHLRESCYAMGATKFQALRQVVLPLALPSILTGAILSFSRALGETAPLVVVGAATYMAYFPDGVYSDFTALPIQIFNWVTRPQHGFIIDAAAGIIVLLGTLLLANSLAIFLRNRYQTEKIF